MQELVNFLIDLYIKKLRLITKVSKMDDKQVVLTVKFPILLWCTNDNSLVEAYISGYPCSGSTIMITFAIWDRCDDIDLRIKLERAFTQSETEPKCTYIITNVKDRVAKILKNMNIKCTEADQHMLKCCIE